MFILGSLTHGSPSEPAPISGVRWSPKTGPDRIGDFAGSQDGVPPSRFCASPDSPQFGQEVARLKGAGKMAFGTQAKPALQNRNSPAQLHAGHARRIHPKQAYIYYSARVKRLSVRANERDPSLRFVARDGHPSRMAVLPRASTTKNRASEKSGRGLQTDRLRLSLRGLYACGRRCYKQRIWCMLTDGHSLNAKDKKVTPRRGNP